MKKRKNIGWIVVVLLCCGSLFSLQADTEKYEEPLVETELLIEQEQQKEQQKEQQFSQNQIEQLEIPSYNHKPYETVNNNAPFFSEKEKECKEAFENYSELDVLGRCGVAYANICKELMPTTERGEIGMIKPSGWHTVKYNDLVEGNYLYNRCHLIGYQLAGENANEKNLMTGTRYLNVVGMLEFENQVAKYVESTDNHVLYRVTPFFEQDNLLASGVEMEAWSVEDSGKGICFNVFCFNVQPGIEIDYATGESKRSTKDIIKDNADEMSAVWVDDNTQAQEDEAASKTETKSAHYVLNTNTKKIHIPTCPSVDDMAKHNKKEYDGILEEIEQMGYRPCKNCLQ